MGRVYRALDLQLDRQVAIKVLGSRTVNDPAFIDRFKREARLAAQLNHPNIATIYAFGEEGGEAYIAMEFVEGETLTDRLARGPLSMAEVRKFGRQAAAALATAHEKGIVHRDIKPGNLMINREGELKVMDFGVARRSGETEMTMAGSLIGTANIMAPELVRGETATPAADLFSLGCVLYEMLTGRPAFEGDTALAILFQVANHEPPPLENLRSETPADLRDLVNGLLVKDPAARFGPARGVADRLAEGGTLPPGGTLALSPGGVGTMVLPSATTLPATKPKRRMPARTIMLGLVAVAMLAAVGLWGIMRKQAREHAIELTKMGEKALTFPDSAIALFQAATEAYGGYAPAWNNLGLLQFANKDTTLGIQLLEKSAKVDEKYDMARLNLADVFRELGDAAKAESFYDEVISLKSSAVKHKAYLGLARLKEDKDPQEAIRLTKLAIRENPSFAPAYNNLGFLFVQNQLPDSAIAICQTGIALFRNDSNEEAAVNFLHKNLGDAFLMKKEFAAADSAYELAGGINTAVAGRARVAEARGDREAARMYWRMLLTDRNLGPEASQALQRLNQGG